MGVYQTQNQNQTSFGFSFDSFHDTTPIGCTITQTKLHHGTPVLSPTWFYARALQVSKNLPPEAILITAMMISAAGNSANLVI
jgi:hypothetical protein